jgi:hypothetical protein
MYCKEVCYKVLQLEIGFLEDAYAEFLKEGEDAAALNFIWKEIQRLKSQLDHVSLRQVNQ